MTVKTASLTLSTRGNADMVNVTDQVAKAVAESGIKDGIVIIFTPSSTSALTTIEYEAGCLSDLRRLFDEIVDPERHFAHNARWGDGNGHSHVRAALVGASFTIPFVNKQLSLGTWQQLILIDFDNRSRKREIVVQILGE